MSPATALEMIARQSEWYGNRAKRYRFRYTLFKTIQILVAAAIPVVSVAEAGQAQRWTNAVLGALVGVIEGLIQMAQFQQNWLLYRATSESLRREEFLYHGKAGPYAGAPDADAMYVERCDAIMSGEHAKWLDSQAKTGVKK